MTIKLHNGDLVKIIGGNYKYQEAIYQKEVGLMSCSVLLTRNKDLVTIRQSNVMLVTKNYTNSYN